ncbi:hypothetical protein [Geodermatophilus sp. DF01-2]|nr:hypothetical protein [Geodermatophilus sp. DF01_2]
MPTAPPRVLVADDVARGLVAGAEAHLAKPFSVAGLAVRVRELATGATR